MKASFQLQSGGKFIPIVPTAAQVSAATAWQTAYISIALEDVNVDGYVDVGLSGGWDFGDWLPGSVSNEQQDAYTLILSIVSTRDVTNNQTPACISQDPLYYQFRTDRYIAPADFVQVMNNAIQGNANWNTDRFIYLSGPGVYLREIEDFGFFDAKHAKAGYAIENNLVLAITEFLWEQLVQGCQSSNIAEDILSNHISVYGVRACPRQDELFWAI